MKTGSNKLYKEESVEDDVVQTGYALLLETEDPLSFESTRCSSVLRLAACVLAGGDY